MKRFFLIATFICIAFLLVVSCNPNGDSGSQDPENQTISVIFNTNGGKSIPSQHIKIGTIPIKPADPKLDGYAFIGWYTDKNFWNEYDFATPLTKDTTLYAKWEEGFRITWELNLPDDYESLGLETINLPYLVRSAKRGEIISEPNFAISYYDKENLNRVEAHANWYIDEACTKPYDFSYSVYNELTLYAKWGAMVDENSGTYSAFNYDTLIEGLKAEKGRPLYSLRPYDCVLLSDISIPKGAEEKSNWDPIAIFTGMFDGNNHTIDGVYIVADSKYVGFFEFLNGDGIVKDLNLSNLYIKGVGDGCVGGIAGSNGATIQNCSVNGLIEINTAESDSYIGGIAGDNMGEILQSHFNGNIKLMNSVNYNHSVGGLAGNNYGSIEGSYFQGEILTENNLDKLNVIGGICGTNDPGQIFASYSIVQFYIDGQSETYVGGVSGKILGEGKIISCYSKSETNNPNSDYLYISGIIGTTENSNSVSTCFWDSSSILEGTNYPDGIQKVDGTSITWDKALDDMNNVLANENINPAYWFSLSDIDNRPLINNYES